jgi:excisionase family DNA binding protein
MPFTRRWLSPKEVALEYGIHPQTVYKLFYQGKIPGGRIGGVVRIDRLGIEQRLEGKRKK